MNTRKHPHLVSVVLKSRFFVAAVLVHVLLGLVLVGRLLIPGRPPQLFTSSLIVQEPGTIAPERPQEKSEAVSHLENPTPASELTTARPALSDLIKVDPLLVENASSLHSLPLPGVPQPLRDMASGANKVPEHGHQQVSIERQRAIDSFSKDWVKRGSGGHQSGIVADFTCVVGKPSQGGDALAFSRVDEQQQIFGGSIVNLNEMINRFSKGRVRARLEAQAMPLDSAELFEKRPPYVYLTGRRDFRLTEAEVTNLRAYLNVGGCIWGDSGLPGRRSPFDIAFRREMKRVIPDPDKPFEVLAADHPLYRAGFFRLAGVPAGLNHAKDPIECIKIEGVEAVIYTANGYGAMWQATLDDSMKTVDRQVMSVPERVAYAKRSVLFRNWEEEALLDSYKLGINVTTYLLTRFQQKNDGI